MPDWLPTESFLKAQPLLLVQALVPLGKILLILAVYGFTRWLLRRGILRLLTPLLRRSRESGPGAEQRMLTLESMLRSVVNYLLGFIAAVMILDAFGLNIGAILAGAGVAGMAIGFGAQRLVRDVITGFLLLVEDQYAVGDRITVGDRTAVVEEIGMRVTRLRDDAGKLVILANGDISAVINHSRGTLLAAVDVPLPIRTDLEPVRAALSDMTIDAGGPLLGSPVLEGISGLDATSVVMRVTAPARPGRQQEAEMLLRRKIHEATMPSPEPP